MNRWYSVIAAAMLMAGSTGCLHHNTRGGCNSCPSPSCSDGACADSCQTAGPRGVLSRMKACSPNKCGGNCESCGTGVLGRIGGMMGVKCKGGCGGSCGACGGGVCQGGCGGSCGVATGGCGRCGCGGPLCRAGALGWQQGGLDYSSHLHPGLLGHGAGAALNNRPFTPGPPSAQVGYPYYTVRGPRDFLACDPPSIGR